MTACSWVDKDTLAICGNRDASVYGNQYLCNRHTEDVRDYRYYLKRANALQAAKVIPYDQFPGYCYVILLPDDLVKIGYSSSEDGLNDRLRKHRKSYGEATLLARLPGGFVAEAVLHDRFKHDRLPGVGEVFTYSEAIREFINSL